MASYFAKLSSLVSGGYTFPYTLGDPYSTAWGSWTHSEGVHKDTGAAVSIFRVSSSNKDEPKMVAARNGVKRLRTLRHPNILQFKDMAEVEERGETVIYLVTEACTPLADHLQRLDIQGQARSQYLGMGLFHCVKAVSFLNNDCKLIHGNVCMAAVVVTEQLDWRLHGFDLLSEHAGGPADMPLLNASWMVAQHYKPGEVGKGEWSSLSQSPPWAVDAWGLGCLLQETFSGRMLTKAEDLRQTASIPPGILQEYQRLLGSQPGRRLNPSRLVDNAVLHNKLVDITASLENLSVKDAVEKDSFFKQLPGQLPAIPKPVAQKKLLPQLSQALEFGGAPASALGIYLKVAAGLSDDEYKAKVVPSVARLFASNDRAIRRSLLEGIDSFARYFDTELVEEKIFPAIATGFTDSNAYLRELTLKSMLSLAPLLSQRTISQVLLKHLAKLQVDEEAPIRANTTILLGNLAVHLSEATQKRVLLNAFTRALKDTFPPARVAGLKAVVATAELHSSSEAAQRIVPAVAPLAADPIQDVRAHALAALDCFVKLLRDAHAETSAAARAEGDTAKAGLPGSNGWTSGIGSNLGWAISSFGLNRSDSPGVGAAAAAGPATPASAPAAHAAAPPSRDFGPPSASSSRSGLSDTDAQGAAAAAPAPRPAAFAARASTAASPARPAPSRFAEEPAASVPDGDDAWEDMDMLALEEPKPAPVPRARRGAGSGAARAGRRPLGQRGAGQRGAMKLGASKLTTPRPAEPPLSEW